MNLSACIAYVFAAIEGTSEWIGVVLFALMPFAFLFGFVIAAWLSRRDDDDR